MASNHDSQRNSRADERVDLQAEVDLEFESFQGFLSEFASNLSVGGMFVRSEQPAPAGTRLDFVLKLKDDFKLVYGKGQVVWARTPETAGSELEAGMGVRFLELRGESRELIQRIVDQHMAAGGAAFDLESEAPPEQVAAQPPEQPPEQLPEQLVVAEPEGHIERPSPPTVKASVAPQPASVVDFAADPDAGRVVDSAAAAAAEQERQERERRAREEAQGPIDPAALADFLEPAERMAEERPGPNLAANSTLESGEGSGDLGDALTPWPESLRVPDFSPGKDLDDTDLTGEVFVPPPSEPPAVALPPAAAPSAAAASPAPVDPAIPAAAPVPAIPDSMLDSTVVSGTPGPQPPRSASLDDTTVAALPKGKAPQEPPPTPKRRRLLSPTTILLVLVSAGLGALISTYSEPLVNWISGYDSLRDSSAIVDIPPPATLRAESAEARADAEAKRAPATTDGESESIADEPAAQRGSTAPAALAEEAGAEGQGSVATTASLASVQDPMTRVRLITWKENGGETTVTLWGDGYLSEDNLVQVRLEGENAREVVKLRGINWPYREPVLYVNSGQVDRVRVGFHPKPIGNELHIVLDLADASVQLSGVEREANKLQLRFTSS
ncbi:MAG: TIGR02266 family protein [Acidobacteriota bacterium]